MTSCHRIAGARSANRFPRCLPRRQAGLSLLEVLVAVLIVSVGILGVAGLQGLSLRNNSLALHRTEANALANDILDRIRANPEGVIGDPTNDLDNAYALDMDDDVPAGSDCEANTCTPAQMASYDLRQWMDRVEGVAGDPTRPGLPNGDASLVIVENDVDNNDVMESLTVTVTLRWAVDRAGTLADMVLVSEVDP